MSMMITPGPVPGRRKGAQDRLATGTPRYGGVGTAPTSGTVDPTGYVERGRRSGLARSLLARTSQQAPGGDGVTPAAAGPTPGQLGETASRLPQTEIVRRLAARLTRPAGR